MPDLGIQIELGDRVDGLIRRHPFGFEGGTGALLKPAGDPVPGTPLRLKGEFSCHGCGHPVPFRHTVFLGGGALFGGPSITCPACGSQASLTASSHLEGGRRCGILVATPLTEPAAGRLGPPAFLAVEARWEEGGALIAQARRTEAPSPAPSPEGLVARALATLPAAVRARLAPLADELGDLVPTDEDRATAELEAHNQARRTVWGDQAAILPILRGRGEEVLAALFRCIAEDFRARGARDVAIERVESLDPGTGTAQRLEALPEGARAALERRIARHRRHAGEQEGPGSTRKLILTVQFQGSFGRHELLRVGEEAFLGMACTLDAQPAAPAPRAAAGRPAPSRRGWHPLAIVSLVVLAAGVLFIAGFATLVYILTPKPLPPEVQAKASPFTARLDDWGLTATAGAVKQGYFEGGGATMALGRTFLPEEYEEGAEPVAILSARFHQQRFGGDPSVLGRRLRIGAESTTVVGVASEAFSARASTLSLWIPARGPATVQTGVRCDDLPGHVWAERVRPGHLLRHPLVLRLGRLPAPPDFEPGAAPVMVVSESFARRLGPSDTLLGRVVRVDGVPVTVVGVVSDPETKPYETQLWLPVAAAGTGILPARP